jgi:hypothetical protein
MKMNPKYISKTINLPQPAAVALDKAKAALEQEIGAQLSFSQVIQVLAVQYTNKKGDAK